MANSKGTLSVPVEMLNALYGSLSAIDVKTFSEYTFRKDAASRVVLRTVLGNRYGEGITEDSLHFKIKGHLERLRRTGLDIANWANEHTGYVCSKSITHIDVDMQILADIRTLITDWVYINGEV